jgi:hypothetical protein
MTSERDVVIHEGFRQIVECLQSRVTEHSRKFVQHLIGEQERVFAVNEGDKQFAREAVRALVGSNQNRGIENDLH